MTTGSLAKDVLEAEETLEVHNMRKVHTTVYTSRALLGYKYWSTFDFKNYSVLMF